MNSSILVIGAGPVGTATAHHLLALGHEVTVFTRSGTSVEGARSLSGNAASRADLERALSVSKASKIVDCMHARYTASAWLRNVVPAERVILASAASHGVHVTFPESVYAFGSRATTVSSSSPITAVSGKPGIRAQLLRAREESSARVCSVVASDLYGPGCGSGSVAHRLLFTPIRRGSTPMALVARDIVHPFTYLPDYARSLAEASLTETEGIEVTPTADSITQRKLVDLIYRTLDQATRTPFVLTPWMMHAAGVFNPDIRGMIEMVWLWNSPRHVVGSTSFAPTTLQDGVVATLEQMTS